MVTAELAVCLPALALVLAALLWGLATAAAQIRCIDAARVAARAVARDEPLAAAVAAARTAAPAGAAVTVTTSGDVVTAEVAATVEGPGALGRVPAIPVGAVAEAVRETGAAPGGPPDGMP